MQTLRNITRSGTARTIGLALVLACVVVGTAITHADLSVTHNFSAVVYNGDPANDVRAANVPVQLIADTAGNSANGRQANTDSNGTVNFGQISEDGYTVQIAHNNSDFDSRDYHVV